MNDCSHIPLAQDWLDGALDADAAARFEMHLAGCAACALEVAGYRRVWSELAAMPLLDPRPGFADRVLAEVFPTRTPAWWRVLGWAYAVALAITGVALGAAWLAPGPRAWTLAVLAAGARSLAGAFTFVLHTLGATVSALTSPGASAGHVALVARRVATPLLQVEIAAIAVAALIAGAWLLGWMRARDSRTAEEIGHVGLLGI